MTKTDSDVYGMRTGLHELVKAGKTRDAIEEVGRSYGFKEFRIMALDWYSENLSVNGLNTLFIGTNLLERLETIAQTDGELAEIYIEIGVGHEAGHTLMEGHPVQTDESGESYAVGEDELNRQKTILKIAAEETVSKMRKEAEANKYAIAKYGEGRTQSDIEKAIATLIWNNPFVVNPHELRYGFDEKNYFKPREEFIRELSNERLQTEFFWFGQGDMDKIADKVLETDKRYRGNFLPSIMAT